jgi:DNA-binding transcriptional regulator YdaS (Cro superfamily)
MDTPISHFQAFVKLKGGRDQAAESLGISVGMVSHILCGRRGISVNVAQAIHTATDGEISKTKLRPDVWADEDE